MRFRYLRIVPLIFLWELLIWMIYNGHLLKPRAWVLFDEKTIYESFYLGGAYFNAGTFIFVLVSVVIFIIIYCEKLEMSESLIRYSSRESFFVNREGRFCLIGTMYSLIHFSIGFALSNLLFQKEYIYNMQTMKFYAFSAAVLSIYFIRISTIYIFLQDTTNKRIKAIFLVLILCSLEVLASEVIWHDMWFPCKDLSAGALTYLGRLSIIEMILTFGRQIGLTMLVFLMGMKMFDSKDVLDFEK